MQSPDLVSSSLQTQFEYPRQQHSENALYIHVALTFAIMKGMFFLCQSIKDNQGRLYLTARGKGEIKRQIWYMGNRMWLVPVDVRELYDQLAHERPLSALLLDSHITALSMFFSFTAAVTLVLLVQACLQQITFICN